MHTAKMCHNAILGGRINFIVWRWCGGHP